MVTSVRKRDGSVVSYDPSKIENAVRKAFIAVNGDRGLRVPDVLPIVNNLLKDKKSELPTVERIQDLVEIALQELGEYSVAKAYILYRHERTKIRTNRLTPDKRAVSDYIFSSKYSRGETWEQCVDRTLSMFKRKFERTSDIVEGIDKWGDLIKDQFVLPSMRCLQFAGPAIEQHHARMYNCSYTIIHDWRTFSEIFYLLLCGCGVGYSVQKEFVYAMPILRKPRTSKIVWMKVEDSIEGWASALYQLFQSYYIGDYIEFDYSGIRPEGSPLITSGGNAPGHIPLKIMIDKVRAILNSAIEEKLSTFQCHEIVCLIAQSVLAGGIRRSSLICLFDKNDIEMLTCKANYEWYDEKPHLAMANNSVRLVKGDDPTPFFKYMKSYGEPGVFYAKSKYHGTNPCGEIGLKPLTMDGRIGFQFCNLTEINLSKCKDSKDFLSSCRAAAFFGCIQSTFNDFKYLRDTSRKIALQYPLLGVSVNGISSNYRMLIDNSDKGLATIKDQVNEFMKVHFMRAPRRLTTVKPSGTSSLLLGAIGSGIHPHHSRRYFRRVTANPNEPAFKKFRSVNPHMCHKKLNGDWVITFPIECSENELTRDEFSARDFMMMVQTIYEKWVKPGTLINDDDITHNVSSTVSVKDDEWEACSEFFKKLDIPSMTFLPWSGDKTYPFAPREAVETEEDMIKWNMLISRYRPVDYSGISSVDTGSACDGGACEVPVEQKVRQSSNGSL